MATTIYRLCVDGDIYLENWELQYTESVLDFPRWATSKTSGDSHRSTMQKCFVTLEMHQIIFGPGRAPPRAAGAYDAPPDPPIGWEGDTPSTLPTSFDACCASTSSPVGKFSAVAHEYGCRHLSFRGSAALDYVWRGTASTLGRVRHRRGRGLARVPSPTLLLTKKSRTFPGLSRTPMKHFQDLFGACECLNIKKKNSITNKM